MIAAILDDKTFKKLYDLAYSLGLDVLCEVHDAEEMQRMINLDVKIIGINNRNLKIFEVNLNTTKKLSDMVTPKMEKKERFLYLRAGWKAVKMLSRLLTAGRCVALRNSAYGST